VAAVGLFSVPLLSFGALLWLFTGFAATWLIAYVSHLFISPDGSTWWHTLMLWRIVEREQKFRHDRFWTQYYDQRETEE
jgi:membrane protein YdbS with pleckstrin-like domain